MGEREKVVAEREGRVREALSRWDAVGENVMEREGESEGDGGLGVGLKDRVRADPRIVHEEREGAVLEKTMQ